MLGSKACGERSFQKIVEAISLDATDIGGEKGVDDRQFYRSRFCKFWILLL
jgi:hypothetical protein